MDDVNRARTKSKAPGGSTSGASRNRFWAGLNRYLAAEAEHERKTARTEQDERQPKRGGSRSKE